jgi:hypothetical protein
MSSTSSPIKPPRAASRRLQAILACAVAIPCLALVPAAIAGPASPSTPLASQIATSAGAGQAGQSAVPGTKASVSATLEQCNTAPSQTERSATFAGEMTAVPGTARMEMRIDVQEWTLGEVSYRTVKGPDLGVWRTSALGVKIYTHIQQVSNLSAPAFYRGVVQFRWLNSKNDLIKAEALRTPRCEQPLAPSTSATAPTASGQPSTG